MDDVLHGWGNFYLITGSAAAALTGLQFVVVTLIASQIPRAAGDDPESGIAAFGTPTVVHFTLALLLSALLCAPWPGVAPLRVTLAVLGAAALLYSALVLRRARTQQTYVPEAEDWIWHVLLPTVAYAMILLAAMLMRRALEVSLGLVGAATLVLICVGIHNAWDTVTYLTVSAVRREAGGAAPPPAPRPARRGRRRR